MFANLQNLQDIVADNDIQAIEKLLNKTSNKRAIKTDINSFLMLSAHNVKHLSKIDTLNADGIMLNLEDGVSKELKPMALKLSMLTLQTMQSDKMIVVRVNPLDEGGLEEIKALNYYKPDAIRVPKIKTVDDVKRVLDVINSDSQLHLSIETKEAFHIIKELKISSQIKIFYLGILDLFADLKLSQSLITHNNPTVEYIMSKFLIDCQSIGVVPVGFTYQDHRDLNGFTKWCEKEKMMGYSVKSCISPKQVDIANSVFKSSEEKIQRAKEIVELFEVKQKEGITGFDTDKFGFIDEPIYKDALNTLKSASL